MGNLYSFRHVVCPLLNYLSLILHMHVTVSGVIAVSWYPSGQNDDEGLPPDRLMPAILDAADKYDLKVNDIRYKMNFGAVFVSS